MVDHFEFFVGLLLGLLLGGVGVYALVQIKGWFTTPEVRKLREDARQLRKRLELKDKHIEEMLQRAEEIAKQMQKEKK